MMHRFGLKTVFSKLFASVMMTLVLFAISMIALTHLVHDNSANTRWQVLARQIVNQIDPFLDELDDAIVNNQRLEARFMLAVIKKSFDIFDESWQAKMGLYDREGHLLVQTDDSDLPKILPNEPSWISKMLPTLSASETRNNAQAMSDRGYTLLYEPRNPPKRSELSAVLNLFTGTILLLGIMTLVLWWIARSMTWRLNQMSHQMVQLGEGDFSVRVPARGTDEIASLALGFNQAAQKIEQLINANNLLLAHASHELRTPITRIRLQVEMMEMLAQELQPGTKAKFDKRAQAIKSDLTGLNDLVESILLVSRLDAGHAVEKNERIDMYDLINQECQHYPEATFYGEPLIVSGQPKLLVHLIRNLLNNAMIHGVPPIDVYLYGVMNKTEAETLPDSLLKLIEASKPSDLIFTAIDQSKQTIQKPPNLAPVINNTNGTVSDANGKDDVNGKSDKQDSKQIDSKQKTPKSSESSFSKRLRRNKTEKATPKIPPNYSVLSVIDHGKGIPLDKRQEIFSPFVRLQQKKKGSGLGLSLVAQIVEAHHGHIRTDVYKGRTRFLVIIPTNNLNK